MRNLSKIALLGIAFLVFVVFALKGSVLLVPSGTWAPAANLAEPRAGASAALLADGHIFISGGDGVSGPLATAELFGTDGSVSPAAPMNVARSKHLSVVLQDGRVLVAGGTSAGGGATNAAEIYDPASNSWSSLAGGMTEARSGATAALLQDGRVLIAGGDNAGVASSTLEIFDPASSTFSFAGTLSSPRENHAMALLADGRVLVVGGLNGSAPLASSDIFDPAAGSVAPGPSLAAPRFGHSATTLLDGRVLVAGGNNGQTDLASAEIYDPSAGTFSPAASTLAAPRQSHLAFLLPHNNNVLIVGGTSASAPVAASELFTPWQGTFAGTGALTTARSAAAGSAMQQDGLLLVAGGSDANGAALASTELYGFATVKTDQADYAPGTTVTFTGSGWQPGETVTLTLVESPLIDTHTPLTAVADANGNISNSQFSPDQHDLNVRFYLTAVGSQSGLQAQNTFTDANDVTSTAVTCNSTTILAGDSTTCTATVKDTGGTNGSPTGSVNWSISPADGNFSPASCLLVTGSNSTSTCGTTFTATSGGAATITGNYLGGGLGNTQWRPSSGTLSVTVNQAPAITSSNNTTFTVGTAGTFTVSATGFPVPTFSETGTLPTGVTLTSAGVLSGTPATSTVGSYPIVITANNGITPNAAQNFTLTVNKANTTTTVTSSANPSVTGQSVTFTATVTDSSAGSTGTPTGTATFKDGANTLGTGTLDGSGVATFSTSSLTLGSHSITAVYGGDANFITSTSAALNQTVEAPATLSYTTLIAFDSSGPQSDTIFRATQSVTLKLTVSNSGDAAANNVTPPVMTINTSGTAASTPCGSGSPGSPKINGGASQTYTYSCGPVNGDGTLTYITSGQASGKDVVSGATVSTSGSATSNSVTVDSTAPTMGLSPATGTYNVPFSFNWSITDPTTGGVTSGVNNATCSVKVDSFPVSTACSGSQALTTAGAHTIVVSASDNADNPGSDSRTYTIILDSTPPVVAVSFPSPVQGQNGWFNAQDTVPVVGSVSANDSTTGNSNVTNIVCTGATVGTITGLNTVSASAPLTVSAEGINNVSCTATDSAGNTGAFTGSTAMPVVVKIDTEAPVLTATRLTAANSNGWNNTDVSVRFACTDGTSLVASISTTGAATGSSTASPLDVTIASEGLNQSVNGTCKDAAGNSATPAGITNIDIDKTKPLITGSRTPLANSFGWNNTDVTVSFSCAETGAVQSGVDTNTVAGATVSSEGASQSVTNTGSCVDVAGNTADPSTVSGINIDKTKPTASAAASPGPNVYGWNNQDVTVTFAGNDSLSGIASCDSPVTLSSEGTNQFASGTCKDKADNVSDPASVTGINIDKTKPVLTGSRSPLANSYGWNNTDVTVSFTCADAGSVQSGIATNSAAGTTLSGEGVGQSVTNSGSCTDKAGNPAQLSTVSEINIDKTNPTITLTITPGSPAVTGWYNTNTGQPTVSFTCNDGLSGVASCTPPVLVGEGANQTISGTAMDKAGNSASTSIMHVNVDVTAPTINLLNPANGGSYVLNQSATASYSCADTGSSGLVAGSAGCGGPVASGSQFDTASVGSKSFTVNAKDVAGNTAFQMNTYGVFYSTGACLGDLGHTILQPINASGTMSVFKLGSTVPTKFRVCDANGASIGTPGVVTGYGLVGAADSPTVTVDEDVYSTTPDTAFRWDPTGQQWIFNQSTKNNGTLNKTGTTYYFGIKLNDGSWIYFQYGLK